MLNDFLCKLAALADQVQIQNVMESEVGLREAEAELTAHVMNHLSYLLGEDWKRELADPQECVRQELRKLERKLGEEFGL